MHSKNTDWSLKSYKTLEIGVKYAYMWRKLDYVNLSYDRTGSLSPFSSVHYWVSFWKSVCLFIWNYTAPSALDLKRFFSRLVFWNLFIEKLRSLSPCVFSSFHYLLMSASCLFHLCPNCITHLPPGAHCLEGETSPQLWRLSWVFISVCVFE